VSGWLDPALWHLAGLKLRGRARLAARRLRTPKGLAFGVTGFALVVVWIFGLALRLRTGGGPSADPDVVHALAALAIFVYTTFAITANLSWRGLYLPKAEVERLFAAPLPRRQLVRFRLVGLVVPSAFVATLVGVMAAARVPTPAAGFLGGVLVVAFSVVLGQGAALLAAREGGLVARLLGRLPAFGPRLLGSLGLVAVLLFALFPDPLRDDESLFRIERGGRSYQVERRGGPFFVEGEGVVEPGGRRKDPMRGAPGQLTRWAMSPAVRAVTLPTYPLARVVAAPNLGAAAPWLALSLALFVLLVEVVARLPVDFREASLTTSRDVERRLARLRRGQLGVGSTDASALRGWRVPWVFGHSPFGAVLWLKTALLVRQGRTALTIAILTSTIGLFIGVRLLNEGDGGTFAIVMLGVAYLASGLRFDFRAELDRMEILRAWPLPSWKVFLAGVLPVTLFVAVFVSLVIALRGVLLDDMSSTVWIAIASTPLAAYLWIALDNVMFLLFPVRFVPGMGGALQHSGRALLMVLLRLLLIALVLAVAAGFGLVASLGVEALGGGELAGTLASYGAIAIALVSAAASLTAAGGAALARFDPGDAALAQS